MALAAAICCLTVRSVDLGLIGEGSVGLLPLFFVDAAKSTSATKRKRPMDVHLSRPF